MRPPKENNSEETGINFECQKCAACCTHDSLLVTVNGHDISRIASSLTLSADEIVKALDFYILESNEEIPDGLKHIPQVNTERGPAFVAIKKSENGDCVFLDEKLCMIHPIRPAACISFPFFFDNEGTEGMSWGLSALKDICPGIGVGPVVSQSYLRETGLMVLENLEIYRSFTQDWNNDVENPTAL
ncbi:MAG: YkgJ family cysteine cluster protein, partial [Candidatus Thorarchaeota archaeon]